MNTRRRLLIALSAAALPAFGQQRKIPVIGYMSPVVPVNNSDWRLEAFLQGMRDLGYADGQNMRVVVRWGEGKLERMPAIARELVKMKVDVIVATSSPSVLAARDATKTIPIVMPSSSDPVGDGLVKSLAHPGGNITGLSLMAPELGAKRLQLLKQVLKKSRDVVVLWNPAYTGMRARFKEAQQAAPTVGMSIRSLEVRDPREMEAAFEAVTRARPDGLVLLADPLTNSMRARIVEFARENRLPAIYEIREFVEAGGLMSYGPNISAINRRSAYYVDRILKGANPGDLPIEQPSQIELLVNTRTARELGITIPQSILASADQVIQ
ncbi:MAG TPA: ABC transporter substrate-binding protein [Burkholderiales bacterium]|jgi:putative ABC transport system substrate-binding protein|nr:ABC transporter substrate-binding protein [Burkholderiales bacterium]